MNNPNIKDRFYQLFLPILIEVGVVIFVTLIIINNQIGAAKENDTRAMKNVVISMQNNIQNTISTAKSVEAFYLSSQAIDQSEFDEFASLLIAEVSHQNKSLTLQWVDAQNIVRFVYPMNDANAKVVGLDNNKFPNRLRFLDEARLTREAVVTEPLLLVQGYPGVILYVPIFKGEKYMGAAVALVKISDIFTSRNIGVANPQDYWLVTDNAIFPFDSQDIYDSQGYRYISVNGVTTKESNPSITKSSNWIAQDINFAKSIWQIQTPPFNLNNFYLSSVWYWILAATIAIVIWFLMYRNYKSHSKIKESLINEIVLRENLETEISQRKAVDENLKSINQELEEKRKITSGRNVELEELNKVMVNRELKMIELKKEIETLKGAQSTPL